MVHKVAHQYQLIKIRHKISFSAFMRNQTITELFQNQALQSYKTFVESGQMKAIARHDLEENIVDFVTENSLNNMF